MTKEFEKIYFQWRHPNSQETCEKWHRFITHKRKASKINIKNCLMLSRKAPTQKCKINVGEDVEKLENWTSVSVTKNKRNHITQQFHFKICVSPKELKTESQRYLHIHIHRSILIAKSLIKIDCSSIAEWTSNMCHICTVDYYLAFKKERKYDMWCNMNVF